MSRAAFIEDTAAVSKILNAIGGDAVRLFKAPASYYKMRKLEDKGLVTHKLLDQTNERGHALVGWALTPTGRKFAARNGRRKGTATAKA